MNASVSRFLCLVWVTLLASNGAVAGDKKEFSFTKVDLSLLDQTKSLDERFDKRGLVYTDEKLESYLADVARRLLVAEDPLERVEWRFRVLRDPLPNAFALPDGSVYFNSGLLAFLDNEDQLASVMAHEINHVIGRHSYRSYKSYRKKMVAIHVFSAVGAYAPTNVGWGVTLGVIGAVVPSVLAATIYGYSRELEKEADVLAVGRLTRTGFEAGEMVNVFKTLQQTYEPEDARSVVFYTDHPKLANRIAYVSALVSEPKAASAISAERYGLHIQEVSRQNVMLAVAAARYRTAVANAQRLFDFNPKVSENAFALAEAYRALGPRAMRYTRAEVKWRNLTDAEIEKRLAGTEEGRRARDDNLQRAEDLYGVALQIDPSNAKVHRGWGLLCADSGRFEEAIRHYRKYLEQLPEAPDRDLIGRRIRRLEDKPATGSDQGAKRRP